MDSTAKSQRKILAAKGRADNRSALESKTSPRKNAKSAEKMPELIAGLHFAHLGGEGEGAYALLSLG
jgi:hypothetical protein